MRLIKHNDNVIISYEGHHGRVVRSLAGGAEGRMFESPRAKRLKISECPPRSEWIHDKLQGRLKAAKGENWAPPITCVPKTRWGSNTPLRNDH